VREMNPEAIRVELQRRRRTILETARRAAAELDSLRSAERDPEFEEGARTDHEALTLSRLGEAQRREVQQIDAALARLDAGEYGRCRECGQDIDPRRLAALPHATHCAACAEGHEGAGKAAGEPAP